MNKVLNKINNVTEEMYQNAEEVKYWYDINGNLSFGFEYKKEYYYVPCALGVRRNHFTWTPDEVKRKKDLTRWGM